MPTKVLILTSNAILGGASRSLGLMIEHLAMMDIQVLVLAPSGRSWSNWQSVGAAIKSWLPPTCSWLIRPIFATYAGENSFDRIVFMLTDLVLLPYRLYTAQKTLRSIISKEKIEIIFVNTLALFCLSRTLQKLKNEKAIKIYWQIREVLNPSLPKFLFNKIRRNVASASSRIIAISSNEEKAFKSLCPVEILSNPIPWDWPQDPPKRVLHKPAIVAMTGAYRPSKGIQDYYDMVEIVRRLYPETKFLLYAPHPIMPKIKKLLRYVQPLMLLLSEKVFLSVDLLDHMTNIAYNNTIQIIFDHDLSWEDYSRMDIYVRSDRSGSPWGRDIIEAMWSGLPIVATGSSEVFIENGKTGYLVDSGRPELLAKSVIALLEDDDLYLRMARSSSERARLLFDRQNYRDRMISLFNA